MSYTIRSVSITNIKGIAHLKFEPGTLSVIRGQNGTGKTVHGISDEQRNGYGT